MTADTVLLFALSLILCDILHNTGDGAVGGVVNHGFVDISGIFGKIAAFFRKGAFEIERLDIIRRIGYADNRFAQDIGGVAQVENSECGGVYFLNLHFFIKKNDTVGSISDYTVGERLCALL